MITAFIDAHGAAAPLARTLASLVPGAVEGLVREVVVIGDGSGDLGRVASDAGCAILPPREIAAAIANARGEWLLLVEAGVQFLPGWVDGVADYIAEAPDGAGGARFRIVHAGRRGFLDVLRREPSLRSGVLVRRSFVPSGIDLPRLARSVRTRHRLKAEVRTSLR